jgi:hypothetical protein
MFHDIAFFPFLSEFSRDLTIRKRHWGRIAAPDGRSGT